MINGLDIQTENRPKISAWEVLVSGLDLEIWNLIFDYQISQARPRKRPRKSQAGNSQEKSDLEFLGLFLGLACYQPEKILSLAWEIWNCQN